MADNQGATGKMTDFFSDGPHVGTLITAFVLALYERVQEARAEAGAGAS